MKVLIIDDDSFVTMSLQTILNNDPEIQIVGIGTDGTEALPLYKDTNPDVVLMDIRMKEKNGLDASKDILDYDSDAKILLLTTFQDEEYIIQALLVGTKGYLLKQDYESLIPSIKTVFAGQLVYGKHIIGKLPTLLQKQSSFDFSSVGLTEREIEIAKYISLGLSNKEIASTLFLSEGTIRNYLSTILAKLDLRDRTQLAIFYLNHKH
jgi:DNA-binding NarL/FixJ family response regulator